MRNAKSSTKSGKEEVDMKVKFAACIDFDGETEDSDGGFSITTHYLLNGKTDPEIIVLPWRGKEFRIDLSVTAESAKWTVTRIVFGNPGKTAHGEGPFSEKSFATFGDMLKSIESDERAALSDFLDYAAKNLEREIRWFPDCKALIDELKRYRDAENASGANSA